MLANSAWLPIAALVAVVARAEVALEAQQHDPEPPLRRIFVIRETGIRTEEEAPPPNLLHFFAAGVSSAGSSNLNRSQRVALLWGGFGEKAARFEAPRSVFVNAAGRVNSSEVIRTLANQLHVPIVKRFSHRNDSSAAAAMLQTLGDTGGPVLVVWRRDHMVELAHAMGCSAIWMDALKGPLWPSTDLNKCFVLEFRGDRCANVFLEQEGWSSLLHDPKRTESFVPAAVLSPILAVMAVLFFIRWQSSLKVEPVPGREPLLGTV